MMINIPSDPAHRRAWVKYQLELAGYSLSSLARELGVSRHAPKLALDRPYPKMERAIAEKIGAPPQEIWPDRYNTDGTTNRKIGRPPKRVCHG
jgi:Ner family transcriptional regulator